MRTLWTVLLVALSAAACRSRPGVPGASFAGAGLLAPLSDAEEAHDALLRADLGRADSVGRVGYAAGFGAMLTSDVVYLRGGLPLVRGRAAAIAIAAAESAAAGTTVRWQPVRAEASRDGRSGYSYGYAVYGIAAGPSLAPTVRIDRYIAYWRREEDAWRIAAYAETYGTPPAVLMLPSAALGAVMRDAPMSRARGPLEAVRAADVAFSREAELRGTGHAFGMFAAEDAQVFSTPGEFVSGPTAIMRSFGPASSGNSLTWHPVAGEVSHAGDLAYTVGNAVSTGRREDGERRVGYSKYLTVWKKQRDGSWRYVVDGGSARPGS